MSLCEGMGLDAGADAGAGAAIGLGMTEQVALEGLDAEKSGR